MPADPSLVVPIALSRLIDRVAKLGLEPMAQHAVSVAIHEAVQAARQTSSHDEVSPRRAPDAQRVPKDGRVAARAREVLAANPEIGSRRLAQLAGCSAAVATRVLREARGRTGPRSPALERAREALAQHPEIEKPQELARLSGAHYRACERALAERAGMSGETQQQLHSNGAIHDHGT